MFRTRREINAEFRQNLLSGVIVATKQDAIANNYPYFFTKEPCVKGHIEVRLGRAPYWCIECNKIYKKEYYARKKCDPVFLKKSKHQRDSYYANNKELVYSINRNWLSKHSGKGSEYTTKHNRKYPNRLCKKNILRKEFQKNLSEFNLFQIDLIYHIRDLLTQRTGIVYHVDHKVPLKNDIVCGLHVPSNLKPIPSRDNLRKRNKYEGEFY